MLIRLKNTGSIDPGDQVELEVIPKSLTKRARLVYVGDFESMDGPVSVTEEHLEKIATGYNGKMAKLKRMALGSAPSVGLNPPVQLDHTRSANDTIGRFDHSDLTIEDYTDEDGKTRKALYGHIKFLGCENVEKVLDGRWSTLSIGADFDDGRLDEVSVTPFPAAEGASVLSKHRLDKSSLARLGFDETLEYKGCVIGFYGYEDEDPVTVVVECPGMKPYFIPGKFKSVSAGYDAGKKYIDSNYKMSAGEYTMKLGIMKPRLSRYFKLTKKMTDEETEAELKKLEEAEDEEELKKLAEEVDADDEKKDKEEKEKSEKLAATKGNITKLSTDFRSTLKGASLKARQANIYHRLSSLRATGKITPAEIKKMNVVELSGKPEETVAEVLKSYTDRQPVIMVGQLGSMRGLTHDEILQKHRLVQFNGTTISQLEARVRFNHGRITQEEYKKLEASFTKLAEGPGDDGEDVVNIHVDTDPHTDYAAMDTDFNDICSMIDKADGNGAKERLKALMDRFKTRGGYGMSEPGMHDNSSAQLAALQQDIAQLTTKFDEAIGLAVSLAGGV